MRIEHDSLGAVEIDPKAYWGGQTQRSLQNFAIGLERFPPIFIQQYVLYKKCCAIANERLGVLSSRKAKFIIKACDEILAGKYLDQFPLSIWQTGSGTQTNMNVNEVIANRAIELMGGIIGDRVVHPNDDVNCSQSSNDSFSVVMHLTVIKLMKERLFPALENLHKELMNKSDAFVGQVKIGRTHLMDALPMKVSDEFRAWAGQLKNALNFSHQAIKTLYELPIGGTAIGSGMNAPVGFDKIVLEELVGFSGDQSLKVSSNKYVQIAAHDELLAVSGSLKLIASSLMKLADDIRWLASGPRAGLMELKLPANEPGSSIMPGKVNPTQCEALAMVCAQVMGNDSAISFGASQSHLQLNTYKPLLIYNLFQSLTLLADASESFLKRCLIGIEMNKEHLDRYVDESLMIVTALTPDIGYDLASKVSLQAFLEGKSIKDIVLEQNLMTPSRFDELTGKFLHG